MSNKVTTENREYKSDVFGMLMEYKEYALNVYNVLNHTSYDDPSLVEIVTLEGGVSLSIKDDGAFIVDAKLSLYEHQSTFNPNMPLRDLLYYADIIKRLVKDKNIYGHKLIKIPTPRFVVFYNGIEKRPEVELLKLSDAFDNINGEDVELELKCTVYNINPNSNDEIKHGSYVLEGYTVFVEKVRELIAKGDEEAVSHAVEYCINNHILEEFFRERRDEVIKNMNIDMTFERQIELTKRDYYEDGYDNGYDSGAKSRQPEIDDLKSEIEKLKSELEELRQN